MSALSELAKLQPTAEQFHEFISKLNRKGHAADAMLVTSLLDTWLKDALKAHFKNKSRRLLDKLFGLKAPLGSFSAKIDVAFAIDAISSDTREILHTLRDIRNVFAHSTSEIDFDSPNLDKHFSKLSVGGSRENAFFAAAANCVDDIKKKLAPKVLADAVAKYAESLEKSD